MNSVAHDMLTRTFKDLIADHRSGQTDVELNRALQDVVEAVDRTGKIGKIKVDIKIANNGDGTMGVAIDFDAKPPKPVRQAYNFYPTPQNNLVPYNPKQGHLFNAPSVVIDKDKLNAVEIA